ncbi:uncharacterized protein FOMMEDRAFT_32123 [Fomitiporia mediterranea MF3/22]|uniref:uncharacterized protein n=1 Tax=Fomitiporia mediterranea (strain MF3/22) TaxID=694068 RepID=UPI0004407DDB|nr:uncharacterized protein FOMMEDRAFT_32123 [Fomitiporia mediterranea MF3/22]EJC97885.1 hypothetical protein FOMMEDRAFT_32123 [Fomitiporia mediterranea MF3/22]
MSTEDLIPPNSFSFPENIKLDLHDLVVILLRERLLSDTRFPHARLLETCDGSHPPSHVPQNSQESFRLRDTPKVGYFLLNNSNGKDGAAEGEGGPNAEPSTFLHEKAKPYTDLEEDEVETAFWRVKNHDSGYMLHHALQLVLDSLPKSTKLRIRTPDGFEFSCSAQSFAVAEMDILPKELVYINNMERLEHEEKHIEMAMDQYVFAEKHVSEPWVYLVFGKTNDLPTKRRNTQCVALDINASVLGLRGSAGEPFVMERRKTYHEQLLPRVAEEDLELNQSQRIYAINLEDSGPAAELAKRILSRLERITRGEERYCSYCGKTAPKSQCSKCRGKSQYCGSLCQRKAWSYHKRWCKIDAAAADLPKLENDVEMK